MYDVVVNRSSRHAGTAGVYSVHYAQFGYKVTRVVRDALRLGWCNSGLLFGSERAVIMSMGVDEIAGMDILWTWRVLKSCPLLDGFGVTHAVEAAAFEDILTLTVIFIARF